MEKQGWGKQFDRLEQYYMQKLINDTQNVTQGQMEYLVWQEVIDNNVILPKETVIHVWKDGMSFKQELARVITFHLIPFQGCFWCFYIYTVVVVSYYIVLLVNIYLEYHISYWYYITSYYILMHVLYFLLCCNIVVTVIYLYYIFQILSIFFIDRHIFGEILNQ